MYICNFFSTVFLIIISSNISLLKKDIPFWMTSWYTVATQIIQRLKYRYMFGPLFCSWKKGFAFHLLSWGVRAREKVEKKSKFFDIFLCDIFLFDVFLQNLENDRYIQGHSRPSETYRWLATHTSFAPIGFDRDQRANVEFWSNQTKKKCDVEKNKK